MPRLPNDAAARLRPYLPRILISWLQEAPGTIARGLEGTVVFVDISGFTKMSERLARNGKIGAEEVTDVLGSVFARLLRVAYENGGSLVKFGGDALLLFFGDEDNEIRATRAAFGMRRELRAQGRIQTSAGLVTLRMSIGVSSGIFQFFLLGRSHRELMIAGPAATEVVLMENAAAAGDILLSPSTALSLSPQLLGAHKGNGLLLRQEPLEVVSIPAEPVHRGTAEELAGCIPVGILEHLLEGRSDPQHRQVTVAFVRFDGVDQMIADYENEVTAFALDQLVCVVQEAADRHGVTFLGSDVDKDGGKIILVTGAPDARGDDQERMLLALREIADADPPIPIRIGVNSGHAFVGDVGPPYRRTFTVMGDAVNLAARVMAKAEPGEILATEAVIASSGVAFQTEALEPFTVKGKKHPVNALKVGGILGSQRADGLDDLPLVGRSDQLDVMLQALKTAGAGEGQVIRIVGEAGIGKSRLLQEFLHHAADLPAVSVSCEPYEASTPYFPFRSLLRGLLGIPRDAGEDEGWQLLRARVTRDRPALLPWLPLLGVPFALSFPDTPEVAALEDRFRRERMEQATVDLLVELVGTPTVLTVEDAHWMDEASQDLLLAISRRMRELPLIVCTAGRGAALEAGGDLREGLTTIVLEPLSPQDAIALIHVATEDAPLSPHATESLVNRSGGSPRFLKSLLRALRGSGGDVGDLPGSVEGLVMAQIDRLSPRDRTRLRYLSVLGMSFSKELATELLEAMELEPEDPTWRAFIGLVEHDGEQGLKFRNGLIREVAYGSLPFKRRREVHLQVGEAIEERAGPDADDFAELLSFHFLQADEDDKAWRYALTAAERAAAIYANVEAKDFYLRGLEAARRLPTVAESEIARAAEALGDVNMHLGDYRDAGAAYRASRSRIRDDRLRQAGLLLKEGGVYQEEGKFPQALRTLTRAVNTLGEAGGDRAAGVRAHLAANYGGIRAAQGRYRDAVRWCRAAIEEGEAAGELDALARALYALDIAEFSMGLSSGGVHSKRALELYERLGNLAKQAQMMNNLGGFAYLQGHWDEARDWYERGRDASFKTGDVVDAALADANLGEILLNQGHLEEAGVQLRRALRVLRASGARADEVFASSLLGASEARRRRFDEAAAIFDEAERLGRDVGDATYSAEVRALSAEMLVLQGRGGEAAAIAERLLASVSSTESVVPLLLRVHGYALALSNQRQAAEVAWRRSLELGRAKGADHDVAFTLEALLRAGLTDGRDPEEIRSERDDLFARLGIVHVPEVALPPDA